MAYYDAIKKYMFKYLDNLKIKTRETNNRIQFDGKDKRDLFLYVKEQKIRVCIIFKFIVN